jgi:hypothetical protein
MNAQYHLQSLKQRYMDDMVNLAQDFHRDLILKVDQIHSLGQGIAGRDTTIGHLEVQILESDAQILQRNTVIDFLQEQVHDLNQELGDALGHIEMLQEYKCLLLCRMDWKKKRKIQKKTLRKLKACPR